MDHIEPYPSFPFFQSTDVALQEAYSYGDPRGSYPDLPSPGEHEYEDPEIYLPQPESDIEFVELEEEEEPEIEFTPEYDAPPSDYSNRDNIPPPLDDSNDSDYRSPSPDDATPSRPPRSGVRAPATPTPRGRGRGRPRGRGRGARATTTTTRNPITTRRRKRAASFSGDDDDALVRPRKRRAPPAPQLSDEFKRLNSSVTNAWMAHDYDAALRHGLEAVQLNPDYFPLHGTIAEILAKKGRPQDAVGALFAGVHSSREAENWWYVVDRLHDLGGDTPATRAKLLYCYSTLVSLNSKDYQARLGRLRCYQEKGMLRRALNECRVLLRMEPNDVGVLEQLADLCARVEDQEALLEHFGAFLEKCLADDSYDTTNLDWNHLAGYADALVQAGQAADGISKFLTAARWLVGREAETYWDAYEDDREWDPDPEPRRTETKEFIPGRFEEERYGLGLPIDIRIKLGVLRALAGHNIENAMAHLNYLLPEGDVSHIQEYADLFKEAGDVLRETGHHSQALLFYEPMKKNMADLNSKFFFDIAICYQALGRKEDVRSSIKFIKDGERTIDFQIGLAKLYQSQGRMDLMWRLCLELRKMGEGRLVREAGLPTFKPDIGPGHNEEEIVIPRFTRQGQEVKYKSKRRYVYYQDTLEKRRHEQLRNSVVRAIYDDLKALGDPENADGSISKEWLRLGDQLCDEFLSEKHLFPRDKHKPITGITEGRFVRFTDNIEAPRDENELEFERPSKYRSIEFDDWVALLLQYAINNAKAGNARECWRVLKCLEDSNVVYPEPHRVHQLRQTSLYCAVVLDDEAKVLDEARHFFKGSEWATDAFRLKTAAIRAVRCEAEIFSNGPEQKFYLRQIKAMDYTLLAPADRDKFQFRDSNRVRVGEAPRGTALPPQELVAHDAALLALYGHMLYVGGSPATALGYYFRAYVVAPDDAVLNLCLGLAYVALAFKRQAANRQFHLQQGVSFFHRYAALRRAAGTVAQVQEMELNTGLLWNSVGLPHLAVPAYQRCIELSPRLRKPAKAKRGRGRRKKKEEEVAPDRAEEDFAPEAALALRMILAVNGDLESALDLTRKWLVL